MHMMIGKDVDYIENFQRKWRVVLLMGYSTQTEKNHKNHSSKMPNCRKCQLGNNYGY